jgi:hypothetical protein
VAVLSGGHLFADVFPDEMTAAFHESHLVRQAAFEQHTNAGMSHGICDRDEGDVLGHLQVQEVRGLCEYEDPARHAGFDFSKLLPEILNEDFLEPSGRFYRSLADEFEAFIDPGKILAGDHFPGLESLFDFRILGGLAQLGIDLSAAFHLMPYIAQESDEKFFRVLDLHNVLNILGL